jgi:SHS2 domain-containing protein
MGQYNFVDHTADIAIEVTATSFKDLLQTAAKALLNLVLSEINYSSLTSKKLEYNAQSLEELLIEFLNELNFLILVKNWIFKSVAAYEIKRNNNFFQLKMKIIGGKFKVKDSTIKTEIKAATFHNLEIQKVSKGFKTTIVLDT